MVHRVSDLEIVVLGSAGTHPSRDRLCSGFLFRSGGTRLMVDCGNGTSHRLQSHCAIEDLDAVVITHRHADHCVDLVGMYYALRFHDDGARTIDVYAPEGTAEQLAGLVGDSTDVFREVCRFHDIAPGQQRTIGDIDLRFFDANHAVPTVAVRAQVGTTVVAYSGDTGGGDGLVEAAAGADLFLCEASWQGEPDGYPPGLHITAGQAGAIAREAQARRLVLTHIWPGNDPEISRAEAADIYGSEVLVAEDGDVYDVGTDS